MGRLLDIALFFLSLQTTAVFGQGAPAVRSVDTLDAQGIRLTCVAGFQ